MLFPNAMQTRRELLSINVPMCFEGNAFNQAFDSCRWRAFNLAVSYMLAVLNSSVMIRLELMTSQLCWLESEIGVEELMFDQA